MALAAPRPAWASPIANIWYDSDYEFELCDGWEDCRDACEFESAPAVCQRNGSSNVWECKADRLAGGGIGAIMYMVRNNGGFDLCDGHEYCAFGSVKVSGSAESTFYCAWDGDDMDEMSLTGTGYQDFLYFHHTQQSVLVNMEEHAGVDKVTGFIYGLGGEDRVHGSHHDDDEVYADVLHGDGDPDIIWGHDGGDLINAGNGNDTVWAGGGDDVVYLVSGTNEASGEGGNDQVHGGDGVDKISLGDGNDSADGAGGVDTICGDNHDDVIEGATANDVLWGGGGTVDSNDGGPGTDGCDAETETACESVVTVRPTDCPAVTEPSPAG